MINGWLKEHLHWLKWALGAIWTAVVFWVGNYISYLKMKSEVEVLKGTVDMILRTNEVIQEQLTVIISKL